jgi:hypothetical protein
VKDVCSTLPLLSHLSLRACWRLTDAAPKIIAAAAKRKAKQNLRAPHLSYSLTLIGSRSRLTIFLAALLTLDLGGCKRLSEGALRAMAAVTPPPRLFSLLKEVSEMRRMSAL